MDSPTAKDRVIGLLREHAAKRRQDTGISIAGGTNTVIYVNGDLRVRCPLEGCLVAPSLLHAGRMPAMRAPLASANDDG